MEIKWRRSALQEMSDIIDYLLETGGQLTAGKFADSVDAAVVRLASHPEIGPIEANLDGLPYTYRSVVEGKNHKIVYRLEEETIHILVVWDCRQNPETLKKKVTGKK